jgi:hypothetical protein
MIQLLYIVMEIKILKSTHATSGLILCTDINIQILLKQLIIYNYTVAFIDLPTNFDQSIFVGRSIGMADQKLRGDDVLMGIKVQPGTYIYTKSTSQGGISGADYNKTDAFRLFITPTNDQFLQVNFYDIIIN